MNYGPVSPPADMTMRKLFTFFFISCHQENPLMTKEIAHKSNNREHRFLCTGYTLLHNDIPSSDGKLSRGE